MKAQARPLRYQISAAVAVMPISANGNCDGFPFVNAETISFQIVSMPAHSETLASAAERGFDWSVPLTGPRAVITEHPVPSSTFPATTDPVRVRIVAAIGRRGELGRDNSLLFRLKADMLNYRRITAKTPMVMGRKTWESLPKRPLPGRPNIVATRNLDFIAPGEIATSMSVPRTARHAPSRQDFGVLSALNLRNHASHSCSMRGSPRRQRGRCL